MLLPASPGRSDLFSDSQAHAYLFAYCQHYSASFQALLWLL